MPVNFRNSSFTINGRTFLERTYPVGSIFMSLYSTNPSTYFGGTWESCGAGRVPVSVDVNGGSSFNAPGITGGNATHTHSTSGHTLTTSEIPSHTHSGVFKVDGSNNVVSRGFASGSYANCLAISGSSAGNTITSASTGGGGSHSHGNTGSASTWPPYFTCYMWKRTG